MKLPPGKWQLRSETQFEPECGRQSWFLCYVKTLSFIAEPLKDFAYLTMEDGPREELMQVLEPSRQFWVPSGWIRREGRI